MTEAEWQATTEPRPMLQVVSGEASDRKLIFYALACWTTADWYSEPDWVKAIAKRTEAVLMGKEPLVHLISLFGVFEFTPPPTPQYWALMATLEPHSDDPRKPVQISFLRDLFGNPFRPVLADPTWLTSTVVALAEGIYQERAFDRLPILADALMDAGCDNEDVLNHCRNDRPHVRGCWVVDLLTGRS